MLSLLGGSGGSADTDKQLRECQKEIEVLKAKIAEKTKEEDTVALKTYSEAHPIPDDVKEERGTRFGVRRRMPGHFGRIYALHWGNDSEEIVSASQDGKLLVCESLLRQSNCNACTLVVY